ncbi:DUF4386 domain-containing protein [Flagellimonas eckloniae]|uniref:DUF4386 domain-containing protein n=1 Tax=Flagellimonas eckloniae TaxID=346185 RepID=A0A0N8WFI3_9FLAO|nr:DUF4386 domain-containing protein [Allomuricauda eckloniae]KQC28779.1 hypothetical protein AAY42_01880 [Allomuricauda eckloniae]
MEKNQKIGRIIGFLLLLIMLMGIPSVMFRGLSTSFPNSPNFLSQIFENTMEMRISILLDVLASTLWIVAATLLFPMIKKFNHRLALGFFGIWMIYFAIIIFSNISHLSLLSLSQAFVEAEVPNTEYFALAGSMKIEDYFWAHFFSIMFYASAAFMFYYFLFRSKLVPKILSAWGMIAISLVFVACWLNIFDVKVSFYFFSQNGLHMIILMGWLIAKGFSAPKIQTK